MKRIVSVFMAALMAALMFCFTVVPVSAASVSDLVLPDSGLRQYNYGDDLAINIIDQFYINPSVAALGYTKDNSYLSVSYNTSNSWYIFCCIKFDNAVYGDFTCGDGDGVFITSSSLIFATLRATKDNISSYAFSQSSNNIHSTSTNIPGIAYLFNKKIYFSFTTSYTSNGYDSWQSSSSYSKFLFYYDKPLIFEASDNTVLPLGIDVDDWYNWYLSTNDQYLNELYGYNITFLNINENNLYYLLSYFNAYGVDYYNAFYKHYTDLAPCIDKDFIGPLEKTDWNFRGFYSCLVAHYGFYKKYKSMFVPDVKPNVTEDDTTLITDIDVDTVDISLLREILRTLILTYNSVNDVDYDLSSYIFNMYLKMDDLVTDIDVNFTALRSDLSLHFDSLADKIGISVANNLSPSLNSIDNSVNALAVPLTDIDADLNANLDVANNIDSNLQAIDGSVKEINNNITYNSSGGSGGCCSGSGSGSSPEVPEFDFDTLKDGMGNFLDFFVWVCDHLPSSITVLMGAALSVAIYCRICAR